MAAQDVWNLMYVLGNTGRVTGDAENLQRRAKALDGAAAVTETGWRCWVEHKDTGKRIFESPAETAHRQAQEAKRIIRFAEDNLPGFRTRDETTGLQRKPPSARRIGASFNRSGKTAMRHLMFQSAPDIAGRNHTEEVTPLPCSIIPLKGEVSN